MNVTRLIELQPGPGDDWSQRYRDEEHACEAFNRDYQRQQDFAPIPEPPKESAEDVLCHQCGGVKEPEEETLYGLWAWKLKSNLLTNVHYWGWLKVRSKQADRVEEAIVAEERRLERERIHKRFGGER